jgi:elongation factor Ts
MFSNPLYLKREDIPADKLEDFKALFVKEVEGKPENMKEQILKGKLDAYLRGIVLLEQQYIKDPEKTIQNLIEAAVQKFGERVEVEKFVRFSVK